MKKLHRGGSNPDGEPLSAGRVEYLEAARQRVRRRRLRRTAIILAALILVTLFATGAVGASIARVKDLVDTVHIALSPAVGWPQQTGLGELTAVQPMSGSFVAMDEGCLCGVQLRRHPPCQHPERLRPPGAGCGQDPLCAVQPLWQRAAGGKPHPEPVQQNAGKQHLSVRHVGHRHAGSGHRFRRQHRPTDRVHLHHDGAAALGYDQRAGTPVRMAFAADSRRLAVAAVTSSAGQLQANLFVLSLAQGDPVQLSSGDSVPQWLGWLNNDTVLAVYENCAVVYGADGGERGRFDLGGGSLSALRRMAQTPLCCWKTGRCAPPCCWIKI